ncbi:MAG: Stk1 family PASTA domain-containing Ser/Thr kinase [Tissierellia bacterium]|nr:Stk1 family PASTA domain-containing Ser/Thr kinase [Tissierellia bacterium]
MLGTVLGNRYEIIEKIGGGGMALVYKARCRLLNRYVAVKVLREEYINDEEFIKKFRRESQAAASLSHPNIVNIYDVGVEKRDGQDIHYIVMEYIKGKTLKEVIREKGKLTVNETLDYTIQIAEALDHAHKNHIVHRDIKPHNIMINEEGRVKVTDFGIARAASASTISNTTNVVGSVHYFSPEQARGRYTDEKSDIYSLGIVMYEMITGKVPFEGDSPISVALKHIQEEIVPPRKIDSSIPVSLENIILKCVKKSQIERYSSASELLNDLYKIRDKDEEIIIENTDPIDGPTQIIPNIDKIKDGNELNMPKPKKKKKSDGGLKVVFLAILLAFIVVSSLALGFVRLRQLFVNKEIMIPNLIGMEVEKAEEELKELGLKLSVSKEIFSSEYDAGIIIDQNPSPRTKVKEGYTVEVVVSKGKELTKVPNLINRDITEIGRFLAEASLSEGRVVYENSDVVPANIVMSQDPEPFTEVEVGTPVNIVVSKGPETVLVSMPNLVGLTEDQARNALAAYDLKIGEIIREASEEYAEGVVFWQSIKAGYEIEAETAIDLMISTGPPKLPQEPEVPETPEEPSEPNDPVEEEIPFVVSVTVQGENESANIRIVRNQDGNKEVVYDSSHAAGEEVQIYLSGKTDATFEIYQDGKLIDVKKHPEG